MFDFSLDEINRPTLLLRGNKNQITSIQSVKFWQEIIKNIQVKLSLILVIHQ